MLLLSLRVWWHMWGLMPWWVGDKWRQKLVIWMQYAQPRNVQGKKRRKMASKKRAGEERETLRRRRSVRDSQRQRKRERSRTPRPNKFSAQSSEHCLLGEHNPLPVWQHVTWPACTKDWQRSNTCFQTSGVTRRKRQYIPGLLATR